MFGRLVNAYVENEFGEVIYLADSRLGDNSLVIDARIEMMPQGSRSSCILEVYNLSNAAINTITRWNKKYITVEYGYKDVNGGELDILFRGTVMFPGIRTTRPDATHTITKFWAYDLGDAFRYGAFSGYFEAGTDLWTMAKTVAETGQVVIPLQMPEKLKELKIGQGQGLYDNQITILKSIAKAAGMVCCTQSGVFRIITQEENENSEVITFFTIDEKDRVVSGGGLIGIPTMEDDGLTFKCLPNPRINMYSLVMIPGRLVSNEQGGFEASNQAGATFDANGVYRVVKYTINIHNDARQCEMVCKALARDAWANLASAS